MRNCIKFINALYLLIVLNSCQSKETVNNNWIEKLDTIESRNTFLEEIYDIDQAIRLQYSSSDFNANEKHEFWKEAIRIDSTNLIKIDSYLDHYGYPDAQGYSQKAREAPWYVIQHCTKLPSRIKYYSLLKQAFENEKISEIEFYLYLQRNFQFKYGEGLGIENDDNYSFNDKIQVLLDTLKYDK